MALMTHAPNQAEANYYDMGTADQERFDEMMELADVRAENSVFLALMVAAAQLAGLRINYGQEVRRCACSCWCPVIFDPHHPDAHCIEDDTYNLGRHQCPRCADDHRETAN